MRTLLCLLTSLIAAAGLASCGGGGGAVVQIGHTPITQETVAHWMAIMVAGDYHHDLAKAAPAGLVSDPPNYGSCVAAAKQFNKTRPATKAEGLCRQLYQSVKLQAVSFLADATWHAEDAKEHGEQVTPKELNRNYRLMLRHEFPSPGQFQRFLAEMHLTRADEYYLLKRNLLTTKFVQRLQRQHVNLRDRTLALKYAEEWQAKWVARTSCRPGYVALQCKQYKGHETVAAPNTILEQLVGKTS